MKVLHVIPSLNSGGAEKLVLDVCTHLQKMTDVEVKLVVFSTVNIYPELSKKVDLYIIPSSCSLSTLGKNKICVSKLQHFISKFEPDIIHTHLYEAELTTRFINYKKAKYFSHSHSNTAQFNSWVLKKGIKKNITDFYERTILYQKYKTLNNHFIAISKDNQQYLKSKIPSSLRKNISLLSNAIDFNRYYRRRARNKGPTLRLINVGNFQKKIKNQSYLIRVIHELNAYSVNCQLTFLGIGEEKENVYSLAKQLSVDNQVFFEGHVENVEEHLWKSDIYVHSCKREGFGLVMIEAMAAGLPVVSLDAKGNRDFINNGQNGYILNETSPRKFAEQIIELHQNDELYDAISRSALETAKEYNMDNYAEKLLEIYKE